MKRYMAFGYAIYYPSGGMEDFIGDFSRLDDAKVVVRNGIHKGKGGGHVYDTVLKKIIFDLSD